MRNKNDVYGSAKGIINGLILGLISWVVILFFVCGCELVHEQESLADVEVGEMYDYVCAECDEIEIDEYGISQTVNAKISYTLSYISKNYKYQGESGDYWKLPGEFYIDKGGDCEDFCIFAMYLLKDIYNIDTELVLLRKESMVHAMIYSPETGYYYDVSSFQCISEFSENTYIIWYCPYPEVIWMTYNYHDSVGKYY